MDHNSPEFHLGLLRSLAIARLNADSRSSGTSHKNPVLQSGISSATSPTLDQHTRRMAPLLDALAAICPHKEGQVYAVTMSLSAEKVTLFVSENKLVSKEATDHLESVWDSVVAINRAAHGAPPSVGAPSVCLAELIRQLKVKIYTFSHAWLKARLAKRWALLEPFLLDYRETLGRDFIVYFVSLQRALYDESPNFRIVAAEFDDISKLPESQDFKGSEAKWAIQERGWIARNEALVNEWKGENGRAFAPHRCIAKLFAFHTHVQSIINVALSRRLSTYLSSSTIKVVPVEPRVCSDIRAALTIEDIDAAIRAHIDATEYSEKYEAAVKDAIKRVAIAQETNIERSAHCECSLLAYHLQHPEINPLRYIAVSKPPCFACRVFFRFYNRHAREFGQVPFGFKESEADGKLYPGWSFLCNDGSAPPRVISLLAKVKEAMTEDVKARVRQQVRKALAPDESQVYEALDPETWALLKESHERAAASLGMSL
ncbi:hypothetical protein BOTBODRAFT_175209 [Botryobasidium botryosum FD-172 SS1]|uniref:Uncharacterized protein n=1 Tax=Botryobasidium botryosum (strain FD-172 SS1) TaxID=930990 RepID=A0A067MDE4_BOTB1|nr:hypothetical protein BOTBODRAFT_175209 [Botryobasidium botryosum FD-172 SS1]